MGGDGYLEGRKRMRLSLDEEVQGLNREVKDVLDMKAAVVSLIDENVTEVIVKKRAVKDNSPKCQNVN